MAKVKVLCFLVLLLFPLSGFAGVWQDNFDDGRADGWDEVSGDWVVKDGAYIQSATEAEYQKSILDVQNLTDFTLEVDVTVFEGSPASTSIAAGVLVRTNDNGSAGYRFWIRPDQNGFQFSVWQDDKYTHVKTDAAEKAEFGQTYRLKVQLEGFTMSAWVDDRLMVEDYVESGELFASGQVGLINYNAHCQYDNLIMEGENILSNLSVEYCGKLATTWSSIKLHQ